MIFGGYKGVKEEAKEAILLPLQNTEIITEITKNYT